MPNYTQRPVNTFVKGLITEAGELTFPENASIDELNCELFRDGSRRRRKGIALEDNYVDSSFTIGNSTTIEFGEWRNVGNNASKQYLVIQVGSALHFYDKAVFPYSSGELVGFVDLSTFDAGVGPGVSNAKCSFASILGNLVVVSESLDPFYVTEESTGVFTVTAINCRIRDFEWLGNRNTYDKEASSATVTQERKYDTYNCGWTVDTLSTYGSNWPPLTHPWFSGKDSSGNFSKSEWEKVYSGTSLIGNGHFIYNLFEKDRTDESLVTDLEVEIENSRFTAVATFASRVFFSGLKSSKNSGKVYFSQILQDMSSVGEFLQKNDPTSEEISDLLEDDGGVIVIPDASEIKRLYSFRNSIFVFSDNGVWQITGIDNVFSPTAYSVSRVSEVGLLNKNSFTAAEGTPFWWSKQGIHTLIFNEYGQASEQNLSINTVQTFFDDISNSAKNKVVSAYDKNNKKIYWLYPNNEESVANKYNNVLVLDVPLQAFYPWKVSDQENPTDYIIGMQFYDSYRSEEQAFDVVQGGDDIVVGSDDVVETLESADGGEVDIVFFVKDGDHMTMARFSSDNFLDWGSADYSSYAVGGYDFIGELILKKTAPYVVTYLRETETGWEGDENSGYTPTHESSLLFSVYWDYKKSPSSSPQQVYKRNKAIIVDSSDLSNFESPSTVITSRIKVRGRGRSMRFKIESESGKDFIYLGHGLLADVADRF